MTEDPFRRAALELLALPLDLREAAFLRLLDIYQATNFPPARSVEDVIANTKRLTELWDIGVEIGVVAPRPSRG